MEEVKIIVTDETQGGDKDSNHTVSFLDAHCAALRDRGIKHLRLIGDNARTIKSRYLIGWAYHLVQSNVFEKVDVNFMVPGHTKFKPDIIFSTISRAYHSQDIFDINDLVQAIQRFNFSLVVLLSDVLSRVSLHVGIFLMLS